MGAYLRCLFLLPFFFVILPTSSYTINYAQDYGKIIEGIPRQVLHPKTLEEISLLLKAIHSSSSSSNPNSTTTTTTVAARGAAHSIYGQELTDGGVLIDMQSLPRNITIGDADGIHYVDAGGGELWIDVLNETLNHGLTPRSWTDYLYLTVGGTLSNGGISGQACRFGPQIANVLELDIITGKGEMITCSKDTNSDLFYGVLGGLGQFGIITRARIILTKAPKMAMYIYTSYDNFDLFTADLEYLITSTDADYVEGTVNIPGPNSNTNVTYSLQMAIYYNDHPNEDVARILKKLKGATSEVTRREYTYFDFLNRVKAEEDELRRLGLWEVPHPWLNLFVPRTSAKRVRDFILQTVPSNQSAGLILFYPTFKNKWNTNMSAVLPEGDADDTIMYAVSLLRSAPPNCTMGTTCLGSYLEQNKKMSEVATQEASRGGIGAKQYLPYIQDEQGWAAHFGRRWERFKGLKAKFDPFHVLAPGQRIFNSPQSSFTKLP